MKQAIYILSRSEELRGAYTESLQTQCGTPVWFSSHEALLADAAAAPATVVVDLDALGEKGERLLETLRSQFTGSDLIAISSNDSATLALQCLRSGFTDFLVKPLSPEELSWGVRKAQQRREMVSRLESPKSALVNAVTQISASASPTLVRLCALEFLHAFLGGAGAAWLKPASANPSVVLSLPKSIEAADVLWMLPSDASWAKRGQSFIRRGTRSRLAKVFIPCREPAQGVVFIWGVSGAIRSHALADASLVVRHAEMSLLNLTKLEEIRRRTFTDELTGLYNSRYLRYALENAVLTSARHVFSVLFIDVDHFKTVNDRHGHIVGSEFLVAISRTIKNAVRQLDSVFRYGGDEFIVILHDTPLPEARVVAERIRRQVEKRLFLIGTARIQTTVSIGLAVYPDTASTIDEVLRLADDAMYAAKRRSRNAVHVAALTSVSPTTPESHAEKSHS